VTVAYIVQHVDIDDELHTTTHRVHAPTAQSALRVLTLTSTENARVTQIHVEEVVFT
jgi:hypothetical protein